MDMTKKVTPFLWFDDQAEEAAKFYVSIFKGDSKITSAFPPDGKPITVSFRLRGQDFTALNGGPSQEFTEAVSFAVTCKTQKEIDRFWSKLTRGGQPGACGWLKDKYGLSWQIVPDGISKWLAKPAAMQAMLLMGKLDIKLLKEAAKS
jgi:predicted 3-demethylubiquinone-9 3-methyltransferase (glyoxalase superfamily)